MSSSGSARDSGSTATVGPRPPQFDHTYDVVGVGRGGAGFAAALGAVDEGLSVLLLSVAAADAPVSRILTGPR